MSETLAPDFNLVNSPHRGSQRAAPSCRQIPRLTFVGLTHPGNAAYEAQWDFDSNVFRALMVGGLGEKSTPTYGPSMLCLIVGAIRLVCLGDGVNPTSTKLQGHGEVLYGLWSLAWEALETNKLCPTITQSLSRLLVPGTSSAQNDADEASSSNMILEEFWSGPWGNWWVANYYTARQRSSCLSAECRNRGVGLEKFKPKERASLRLLIEGIAKMQPIVERAFRQ